MQVSTHAYPDTRFKLTHKMKIVARGLPSGHRGRERMGFIVRKKKRALKSEKASNNSQI